MSQFSNIIFPDPLCPGDTVAICSPASSIAKYKVDGAKRVLEEQGWKVRVMPHTFGRSGIYSGTVANRFDDLQKAFVDPDVKAIVCSRGGYGMVHLLDKLNNLNLRQHAKWVVGFSDISAMHALLANNGIASLHASMTGHIMLGADDADNATLFAMLRGERPSFSFASHTYDHPGTADGTILGGNLAVLTALIDTPYNILLRDKILFIEDISEPIYKIERMLYQLQLSGVLPNLRGLIVGQFTEYRPSDSYKDMNDMIADMVAPYKYPVAFNAPIGHVDHNIPVIESAHVTLKVTNTGQNHLIYW
jgi:muramoyltetrapeptide carboxypeptidase